MSFGDSLTKIRKEKGISRKDLAEQLDIPYTTLRNYETDQREPGHKLLIKIANLLSVSVDELVGYPGKKETAPLYSSEAIKLAQDYDFLDSHGKKIVRMVTDEEKNRCLSDLKERQQQNVTETSEEIGAESIFYIVSRYASPMSAGTGQLAGQEMPENEHLIKEPPRGTSYIAPVSGDSMEPTYNDGDLLFIHATQEIFVGQIGVFFMDGQQWVKELGKNVLLSHNPAYDPIPMTEDIQCQGLVLGVCDESYFE